MKTDYDGLAKFADVFFNGRPFSGSEESRKSIRLADLIDAKYTRVRYRGKLYLVTVVEAEERKKQ